MRRRPHRSRVASSTNQGITWTLRRLDAYPAAGATRIAASGTTVFTAWIRAGGKALIGRISTDGGRTWQYPAVLATFAAPPYRYAYRERRDRGAPGPPRRRLDRGHPRVGRGEPRAAGPRPVGRHWGRPAAIAAIPPDATWKYGFFHHVALTLLSTSRVGVGWAACYEDREFADFRCYEATAGTADDALWTESTDDGASWSAATVVSSVDVVYGSSSWSNVGSISAVWPSADVRGILVSRWSGEPEWDSQGLLHAGARAAVSGADAGRRTATGR